MSNLRCLAILVLSLMILAAQPASAGLVINAKSVACGGSGPQNASVKVTAKDSVLTFKFKAKDITPNEAVTCGYFCQAVFTNEHSVPCGTVDSKGKFSGKVEFPEITCFGFIPFFRTGVNGSCVPSTVP